MLTIVTGVPGAGKTLFTLSKIKEENKDNNRPVFVHGVAGLDLEYFGAQEITQPDNWYELPHGAIIVFDEAQTVFPQRSASFGVPEKVQKFATHRHQGHDIFITTQDAGNVDVFIRRMCGRHFHVHRILNRQVATIYEFDHFESSPQGYHEKKTAISIKAWRYPKDLFKRYHSATQHTYKARTPWKLVVIPFLVVGVAFMFWRAYNSLTGKSEDMHSGVTETLAAEGVYLHGGQSAAAAPVNLVERMRPEILGLDWTAPFYAEVTKPATFPKPHCVLYGDSEANCRCYSQQITRLDVPAEICSFYARAGWFDHTKEDLFEVTGGAHRGESAARPDAPQQGQQVPRLKRSAITAEVPDLEIVPVKKVARDVPYFGYGDLGDHFQPPRSRD